MRFVNLAGLLAAALLVATTLAGQTATPSQPAASKPKGKSAAKKPARKVVRKPPPVPADIPLVVDAAAVWRGCLGEQDLPRLAASFRVEASALESLLEDNGVAARQTSGCTAYVAATGGEGGATSAVFMLGSETTGDSRMIALHKTPDGIIVTPGVCDCKESARRELSLPAREFTASLDSGSASIPANLRWQLGIVIPHMLDTARAKVAGTEPIPSVADDAPEAGNSGSEAVQPQSHAGAQIDDDIVRVVMGRDNDDEAERLISAEIVEPASGRRVDGAWWLDRPDGAGVIIGMNGLAYERALWEAPVNYVRSARGVGPSTTTYRQRVPARKGSTKTTVKTVKVPSYHLGIDMTARKGTDVHAVGDAKVVVAGRRNGFGNVVILDHGRGYQTYYAHLSKIPKGIKVGVRVACGDVIGLVGSTGRSTAPHLHFETRKDAHYLDPFDETHQLGFWLLTADEQERLAVELLSAPAAAGEEAAARHE